MPASVLVPLALVTGAWRPGSYDPPWSWADEAADILARQCLCCGQPGHYQLAFEAHVAEHGIPGGVCLGGDGRVWDGHHRVVAALRMGITQVPVEVEA